MEKKTTGESAEKNTSALEELTPEQIAQLTALEDPDAQEQPQQSLPWDEDYQRRVLSMVLQDLPTMEVASRLLTYRHWTNETHQLVFKIGTEYFEAYGTLPEPFELIQTVRELTSQRSADIRSNIAAEAAMTLHYSKPGVNTRQAILDRIASFAKAQRVKELMFKTLRNAEDKGEFDIPQLIAGAEAILRLTGESKPQFESWSETCAIAEEQAEDFLIPNWAEFGCIQLLSGLPFSGKSWLISDLIAAICKHGSFAGMPVKKCPFILIDLENKERTLIQRLKRALGEGEGDIASLYHRVTPTNCPRPLASGWVEMIITDLKETIGKAGDRGVVFVDTFRSAFAGAGKSEIDEKDMLALLVPLKQVAQETGWLILMLHHNAKHSNQYSGSTAIAGVVDYTWNWRVDKEKWTAKLEWDGRGDAQEALCFRFDREHQRNVFIGPESKVRALDSKQKAKDELYPWIRLLPKVKDNAVDRKTVLGVAVEGGLVNSSMKAESQEAAVKRKLNKGVEAGFIVRLGEGTNSAPFRYHRSAEGHRIVVAAGLAS